MNKTFTYAVAILLSLVLCGTAKSQTTYYAIQTGNWNEGSKWSTDEGEPKITCNCFPANNAVANIVIGEDVEMNLIANTTIFGNITILSGGNLDLEAKLNLGNSSNCGFQLIIDPQGSVTSNGNGNGEKLDICSQTILRGNAGQGGGVIIPPGTGVPGPVTFTETGAMPVTFTKFSVTKSELGVQLDWSTSKEINNKGFEIQKSADGFKTFETVGFVEGNGNTADAKDYSFTDSKVGTGALFYRLKQIDFNGEFAYSEIKYINGGLSLTVDNGTIFPNPTTGEVTLILDGVELGSQADFTIISADGKMKAQKSNVNINQLDFAISQALSSLSNGSYTILLKTKKNTLPIKVVKI